MVNIPESASALARPTATGSLEPGEEYLPASALLAGFREIHPRSQAVAGNQVGKAGANDQRAETGYEEPLRTHWRHGGINE